MVSWKLIGWRSAGAAALLALAACGQPIAANAPGSDASSEDDGGERGESSDDSANNDGGGESGESGGESGESGD